MAKTPAQIAKAKGKVTRKNIVAFFKRNPFATQADCAAELGISTVTVCRHTTAIKAEQREQRA